MPSQRLKCRAIFDKTVATLPLPKFLASQLVKDTIMPINNQLIPSDYASLAASGLSNDLVSRCLALKFTTPQIFAVSQLNTLYNYPSDEIVSHVENGIALPRVAECLRLRYELQEMSVTDVETVNEYVELINFCSPNEIDDFATDKMIKDGRARTAVELEDILINQMVGYEEPQFNSPIIQHAHDKIIETLLEGSEDAFSESDDPVKELLEKIKAEMDGNILMAYHLCVDQPYNFRLFVSGRIDLHRLHHVDHNPGEDVPVHDEI